METAALVVSGIASILALGAFCVSLWLITHQATDTGVIELAHELKRTRKAEAMRVVREAAAETRAASAPLGTDGHPLPFGPVVKEPEDAHALKQNLRRHVYGGSARRGGNGE